MVTPGRTLLRKFAPLALIGALLTAACGSDSEADSSETGAQATVKLGILSTGVNYWCHYAATDQGFYEDRSIDVPEPLVADDDASTTRALIGGDVDIAMTGFSILSAMESGTATEPVIIGSTGSPAYALVSGSDVDLEGLEGSTISVQPEGTSGAAVMVAVLDAALGKGKWTPLFTGGATSARLSAVESGQAQAAVAASPGAEQIAASSSDLHIAGYFADMAPENFSIGSVMTTHTWLDENQDVAARFMRAYADGCAFIADPANRDEAVRIMSESMEIPEEVTQLSYDATIGNKDGVFTFTEPRANPESISNTIDAMVDAGLLTGSLDLDELIDQSPMDDAEELPSSSSGE
jgi:ABC-type nitrate/sulfonate/bicarbonate transport system substrate-binding protein